MLSAKKVRKTYHPNGEVAAIGEYRNNQRNGTYDMFNQLGQLTSRGHFKNDLRHGKFTSFHTNGLLHVECYDQCGVEHGPFTSYWRSGLTRMKCHYVHGRKQGELREYGQSGAIISHQFIDNNGKWHSMAIIHSIVKDYNNPTEEEQIMLLLTLGITL